MALNTLFGMGTIQDWATHRMSYELTAYHNLAHAEAISILFFGVLEEEFPLKEAKLKQYGERIWGVSKAKAAIEKTESFFHEMGMPTRFRDYDIDAQKLADKMEKRYTERRQAFGEHGQITPAVAKKIVLRRA